MAIWSTRKVGLDILRISSRSVSQPRSAYSNDDTNGFILIAETPEAQPVEQPANGEQVEGQQEEESSGGMSHPRYPC
jgi:hypothetical protein